MDRTSSTRANGALSGAHGLGSSPDRLPGLIHDRVMTLLAHGGETLDRSAIAQPAAEDAGEAKNAGLIRARIVLRYSTAVGRSWWEIKMERP